MALPPLVVAALVRSPCNVHPGLTPHPVGPEGANLFILNLPPDHDDAQLRQLFAGYGNVLSTNVVKDRMTGISKQFGVYVYNMAVLDLRPLKHICWIGARSHLPGFVSFDSPASAAVAIQAMNGFNVKGYQLKVSLKKNPGQPY